MSEIVLDFRRSSLDDYRKCVLTSDESQFSDADESSPADSGYGSFLVDNYLNELTRNGRGADSDKDCTIHSQSSLSLKAGDKLGPNRSCNSDLDVDLQDLLNAVNPGKGTSDSCHEKTPSCSKNTPFSESALNSYFSSADIDMKTKPDTVSQVTSDFSDLLSSISFSECNLNGFNYSPPSLESSICIDDLGIPDLNEIGVEYLQNKPGNSTMPAEGSLSDMLFSISVEDDNKSTPNRFNMPVSPVLTCVDCDCEVSLSSLAENGYFETLINGALDTNGTGDFNSYLSGSFPSINDLPESRFVDYLPKSDAVQTKTTDCELSLFELLRAVNTETNAKPSSNDALDVNDLYIDDGDSHTTTIDLSSCIKPSTETADIPLNPSEKTNSTSDLSNQNTAGHTDFPLLQNVFSGLEYSADTEVPSTNFRQSLFAKALSCKRRKNPSLIQKVANVKFEMFNNLFDRPVLGQCPEPKMVANTDMCIISSDGRRIFGAISCELI